jgi:UPF0755 protein
VDGWTDEKNLDQPQPVEEIQVDDPHLLFSSDDEPDQGPMASEDDLPDRSAGATRVGRAAEGRLNRAERKRRRRRRRLAPLVSLVVILILVGASFLLVGKVRDRFDSPDYSGAGQGVVEIKIASGDSADDVGSTLLSKGVVKSRGAFVNAAKRSGNASDIQPGVYRVKLHSSGDAVMTAILDPANRIFSKVTIPEGSTYLQVLQIAAKQTGISAADLSTAVKNVSNLGLPDGFNVTSAEGFLFPATYDFDPGSTADSVLQTMVAKFTSEYATLGLAAQAKALKLTPYQVLTIASIAESEAKFDADRAKVARVIMNRIAVSRPLQVDATSAYVAKLEGKDPASIVYATLNSPYNSYTHSGLPPTPIGNPGAAAISAAANPPAGNWLFYVNVDAAGHLGFFTDEAAFLRAAATCKAKGWGCG